VTLGQTGAGITTINSSTTNITGGNAAGAITIGGSMSGSSIVSIGANCCTNIGILTTRSGFINIGTGGNGNVYVGNSTAPLSLNGSSISTSGTFQGISTTTITTTSGASQFNLSSGQTQGQIIFTNANGSGGSNFYVGHDSYTSADFVIRVGGGQGVKLTAGTGSWATYSDVRLKKNITPVDSSLDKICNITPVYYEFIKTDITRKYVGFTAQDIKKDFPLIVDENEDGILSLRMSELIPYLVKSIQELKKEINSLKK